VLEMQEQSKDEIQLPICAV